MTGKSRLSTRFVLGCSVVLAMIAQIEGVAGKGVKVLHAFDGSDGSLPSGLIMLKGGNLFGTTQDGGSGASCIGGGCGVVYELAPDGTETVLHSFTDKPDGGMPNGPLIADKKGNLYGTTYLGGNSENGLGTVFEVTSGGKEKVLYPFRAAALEKFL
ncbi:MAG TPA: choice-of-anchor tandem repeat GloVer-containing protein [Rhizomicrobium sp.]|jgi:uncharacterized repeat protein (TIGR03803 family)|nr:choice-of-anchor tandem repeat GloVer-containing protein [Rhizomicrobium sp.]